MTDDVSERLSEVRERDRNNRRHLHKGMHDKKLARSDVPYLLSLVEEQRNTLEAIIGLYEAEPTSAYTAKEMARIAKRALRDAAQEGEG